MNLVIRKMRNEDLDDLYALLSDEEVMRYIEPLYTKKKCEQFLLNFGLSKQPLVFAVEDDGQFIGYVIDHAYDEESVEIGWVLKKACWGKGYAERLTDILIEKALHAGKEVVMECAEEQVVTRHIAERFGLTFYAKENGCLVYRYLNGRMK